MYLHSKAFSQIYYSLQSQNTHNIAHNKHRVLPNCAALFHSLVFNLAKELELKCKMEIVSWQFSSVVSPHSLGPGCKNVY